MPKKEKKAAELTITEIASLAANPTRTLPNSLIFGRTPVVVLCHIDQIRLRFRLSHFRGPMLFSGGLENGEVLRHPTENRKTRGHDGERDGDFAPSRDV